MSPSRDALAAIAAATLLAVTACSPGESPTGEGAPAGGADGSTEGTATDPGGNRVGRVSIVETLDREASFTQGLEVLPDGTMVHSRGEYGESGIDLLSRTGAVLRSRDLPDEQFGEGVTVVPGVPANGVGVVEGAELTAYQLTWRSGVVHTWSLPDLVEGPSLMIEGEGWGLCYDHVRRALWQSDGSETLRLRRVSDLSVVRSVRVTEDGGRVTALNELECRDGAVWANIWKSDDIVVIDPGSGQVTDRIALTGVVDTEGAEDRRAVLNGLAWEAGGGRLLVTGKSWEHFYWVTIDTE